MPQVAIGAVLSAVTVTSTAGVLTFGFSAASFFTSLAISAVTAVLTPKPKGPKSSFDASGGLTQQFRQPVAERRVVYGEARVSGLVAYIGGSSNNEYQHMVITLATHEVAGIDEVIIGDEVIPPDYLDASGNVTQGFFSGLVRIKKLLGGAGQVADPDLVAEVPEWTAAHVGNEQAYIYVRLKWDRDKFPNGIPTISAWVRGKKVKDTRLSTVFPRITEAGDYRITEADDRRVTDGDFISELTAIWSPNAALHAYDYLRDTKWGIGAPEVRVNTDSVNTAASVCDEIVTTKNIAGNVTAADPATDILTLQGDILGFARGDVIQFSSATFGGVSLFTEYFVIPYQRKGTPRIKLASTLQNAIDGVAINITSDGNGAFIRTGEPRYFGGGVLKMDAERGENLREVISGMGGRVVCTGGVYYVDALAYNLPVFSFDAGDIIGPIEVTTRTPYRERFNRVQGNYIGFVNDGNPSDYPAVTSSVYETADGRALLRKLDLPFVQRPQQAQRIAKVVLEQGRQEIVFKARFYIGAMVLRTGDTFYFSFDRYGWSSKIFEVREMTLGVETADGGPLPYVDITAQETAAANYTFNSADDETTVDPAPNTTLSNPFNVEVVTGFSLTSVPVNTEDGDRTFKIRATWDLPDDAYVTSGGQFELRYKLSADTVYARAGLVDGDTSEAELFQAAIGETYDIGIRAVNSVGARSAWTDISGFIVGSSASTTSEDWEFETEARDPDDWENDSEASEDWEA